MVQPPWKTVWQLLKKLNMELPYDPAVTLLGVFPKELNQDLKGIESRSQRDACTSMFITALFTTPRGRRNPSVHQQGRMH